MMSTTTIVTALGALLAWAGFAYGVGIAALCGVICVVTGVVWFVADGIEWLRERARVRRAAARNRLHWGPTVPGGDDVHAR